MLIIRSKSIQIRLKKLSEETGSEILGKAEFMNPGGSVKDRAALFVVKEAEEKGLFKTCNNIIYGSIDGNHCTFHIGMIKSGGTVVEGTAGENIYF